MAEDITTRMPALPRSGVIVADEARCLTCRECEVACSLLHEDVCSPNLSRIRIEFNDFVADGPSIVLCKQCDWPACYYACANLWDEPAIRIDAATGARCIDPELCHGCGACLRACPLTPERTVIGQRPRERGRVYFKCDLCYDRPEGPVCVAICPGQALTYVPAGERRR